MFARYTPAGMRRAGFAHIRALHSGQAIDVRNLAEALLQASPSLLLGEGVRGPGQTIPRSVDFDVA